MQKQAEHVGTSLVWDTVVDVDLSRRPFRLTGDSGDVYEGDVLVIATGAQAKWLGLDSEEAMKGKGVSACATCDGRSEEHTSELQSLMRISYAVFCLKKKKKRTYKNKPRKHR